MCVAHRALCMRYTEPKMIIFRLLTLSAIFLNNETEKRNTKNKMNWVQTDQQRVLNKIGIRTSSLWNSKRPVWYVYGYMVWWAEMRKTNVAILRPNWDKQLIISIFIRVLHIRSIYFITTKKKCESSRQNVLVRSHCLRS